MLATHDLLVGEKEVWIQALYIYEYYKASARSFESDAVTCSMYTGDCPPVAAAYGSPSAPPPTPVAHLSKQIK